MRNEGQFRRRDKRSRPRPLIVFKWGPPELGFRWVSGQEGASSRAGRFLVEVEPHDHEQQRRREAGQALLLRRPRETLVDSPALFRELADLEASEDSIRAFAEEHGWLGIEDDFRQGYLVTKGESYDAWSKEIGDLRHAVELLDMLRKGNAQALHEWAVVESGWPSLSRPLLGELWENAESPRRTEGLAAERCEEIEGGSAEAKARLAIQLLANKRLRKHASAELIDRSDTSAGSLPRGLYLHLAPKDLLGAIWIQFAEALDGESEFRRCAHCKRWFAISPTARQRDSVYCGSPCRMRSYRGRQERARQLHRQGKDVDAIARDLRTTPSRVERWVFGPSEQDPR